MRIRVLKWQLGDAVTIPRWVFWGEPTVYVKDKSLKMAFDYLHIGFGSLDPSSSGAVTSPAPKIVRLYKHEVLGHGSQIEALGWMYVPAHLIQRVTKYGLPVYFRSFVLGRRTRLEKQARRIAGEE